MTTKTSRHVITRIYHWFPPSAAIVFPRSANNAALLCTATTGTPWPVKCEERFVIRKYLIARRLT